MFTIRTHNPSLLTTLRAIAVVTWSLTVDFLIGLRGCTGMLWAHYRDTRRAAAAFNAAHPLLPDTHLADQLDESALESLAREFGRPAWLSLTVLVLVVSVLAIDLAGGWPLLANAVGTALQLLARS